MAQYLITGTQTLKVQWELEADTLRAAKEIAESKGYFSDHEGWVDISEFEVSNEVVEETITKVRKIAESDLHHEGKHEMDAEADESALSGRARS